MRTLTDPEARGLDALALYNGLDVQAPLTICSKIDLRPEQERVYRAEMALQAPAMACGLRGLLVDESRRAPVEARLTAIMERYAQFVGRVSERALGWPIGWSGLEFGTKDLKEALFGDRAPPVCPLCSGSGAVDTGERFKTGPRAGQPKIRKCKLPHLRPGLGLKPYKGKNAKTDDPAFGKEEIEKLIAREGESSLPGMIARAVAEVRRLKKQRELCRARLRAGRFHFSLNVGATVTFRFSSDADWLKCGGNSQNLHRVLREMFIPDPGYVFVAFDLPAAESHLLAVLSGDPKYIAAHELGDCHTFVCRLVWPQLPWPADPKEAKRLADTWKFTEALDLGIRGHKTVRDIGKVLNHAAGRDGTEYTFARTSKLPLEQAREVLHDQFWGTFHVCRKWLNDEREKFKITPEVLIPGLDLRRRFYGRPEAADTFRDALAFYLQAPVAWATHTAFWRLWHYLDSRSLRPGHGDLQVLKHDHDSVTMQVREDRVEDMLPTIKELATVPLPLGNGRSLTLVPGLKVGRNLKEVK